MTTEQRDGPGDGRGNGLKLAAIVCAVVFVISAGAFVVLKAGAGGDDSPGDATNRLFGAVDNGDLIGGIDALAPTERDMVRSAAPDAATQLQRLGLLSSAQLQPVTGVSVATDNLHYAVSKLSDSLAAVDIDAGRITLKGDEVALPLTGSARSLLHDDFGVDVAPGSATRDFAQHPFRLVTVNEGGRWYVSAAYTLAENLRGARPDDAPAYGRGPTPVGADSAEAAVRRLVERYVAADAPAAVALVEPDEARVYADYVALLTPVDPAVIATRNKGKDPRTIALEDRMGIVKTAKLNDLQLQSEVVGGTTQVRITALDLQITDEVQDEAITYDGTCLKVRYRFGAEGLTYKRFNSCTAPAGARSGDTSAPGTSAPGTTAPGTTVAPGDEIGPDGLPNAGKSPEEIKRELELAGGTPPPDNPFSALALFGSGGQLPALTVVPRDGRWYVSPVRSIVGATLDTLRALQPDAADGFAKRIHRVVDRTPTDLADEARDPDNAIFGPGATAKNRLVASCFVEIAMTAGEGAAAEHTAECVKSLSDRGKIAPESAAANLMRDCYAAKPTAPPALVNTFRLMFLTDRAQSTCFKRIAKSAGLPDHALADIDKPLDQPCVAPYQALRPTAPEADWEAADAAVEACFATSSATAGGEGG